MRTATAGINTLLTTDQGTEPLIIVEVEWSGNAGYFQYATKDWEGAEGKILTIGGLSGSVKIGQQGATKQLNSLDVSFTLIVHLTPLAPAVCSIE